MNGQQISVSSQGKPARALLADSQQGVITGTTSRGIFTTLDSGWVLFLSYESFHGPLTLTLSGEQSILKDIKAGTAIIARDGKIRIPSSRIEIDLDRASTWETPPQADILLNIVERVRTLKRVASLILTNKKEPGLFLALNDLLDLEIGNLPPLPKSFVRVDCTGLLERLKTADLDGILAALMPLFGLGPGLTPAGDDLLLGLLLAYRRWGSALRPVFDVGELGIQLNRAASQKTTLLSANLIACAAQGQADERLIDGLDGMLTGSPAPEACARSLSSWGNSSGCDALVGMALAILSTPA